MCGRYTLTVKDFSQHYGTEQGMFEFSSYNVAPTQTVPVVAVLESERTLASARWGLIPSWTKDLSHLKLNLFNARSETAHEKASFKGPLRYKRCLIPVDGFYEWKREGNAKTPYYIQLGDGAPFAFAGLYDLYKDELLSTTILTTSPNKTMAKLHDRMPVILSADDYERWLEPSLNRVEDVEDLLRPYSGKMRVYPVRRAVNNVKNDSPNLILDAQLSG